MRFRVRAGGGWGADSFILQIYCELRAADLAGVSALIENGEGGGERGYGGEERGYAGVSQLGLEGQAVGEEEGVVQLDALDAELVEEVWVGGGLSDECVEGTEGVAEGGCGEL